MVIRWHGKNELSLENGLKKHIFTMNPSASSNNGITRRNFMKKSALTVGAITILSQGTGFATEGNSGDYSSWYSYDGSYDSSYDLAANDCPRGGGACNPTIRSFGGSTRTYCSKCGRTMGSVA